jgi:hypothetical protein
MDAVGGESAGISILEHVDKQLRWFSFSGWRCAFEGARTPLDLGPCGVTLENKAAVLMRQPETVYD